MPTFDIVNKINLQEIDNAVNIVNREIKNRYDFKNNIAKVIFNKNEKNIKIEAENEMQLSTILEILEQKAIKRKISIKIFNYQKIEKSSGMKVRQTIFFREGITPENAKKINKTIKLMKLKIQSQIQSEQIRVSGKKIDDLQIVINKVKKMNLDFPIQFVNMKK